MDEQSKALLLTAIRRAGERLLALWPRDAGKTQALDVRTKEDGSLVSQADMESNGILLGALSELFPADAILSEESPLQSGASAQSGRIWIIDPLDGTASFIHGRDDFSILVALVENGVPIFGVMCFPARNILVEAERGKPALCNGRTMCVSKAERLEPGRVYLRNLEQQHPGLAAPMMDSGLAFFKLACGELDGVVIRMTTHREWDIAAPMAVLFSAGGAASDETGAPLRLLHRPLKDRHVVASNGLIHEQLQGLI
jgi:fructose-1,6-bisphosphatase/inositol monophosphatase family enzyme